MYSIRPLISKSSRPFTNPLMTVSKVPITVGIIVTFMFHSFFFQFSSKVEVLIVLFCFFSILLCGQPGQQSPQFCKFSFFVDYYRLAEISWFVCISKFYWSLCVSFSRTDAGLCIYHFFIWSHLNFFHNSQWITLPNQSCLVLYSFCANLVHSLIIGLIVLSLSSHNLHLLFAASFFDKIGSYGVVLCYYEKRFRLSLKISLS